MLGGIDKIKINLVYSNRIYTFAKNIVVFFRDGKSKFSITKKI